MKTCRECKIEKPLSEFYKHSSMLDGHLNKCIDCVKGRVLKHRELNLEKIREYDKERNNDPKRIKARKEYSMTDEGKKAHQKANSAYRERYPMKRAAHTITRNYIRDGKLIKKCNCSVCNSDVKIEAHHDDYTKPLDVRWLCEKCHKEWHRNNEPIYL